MATAKNPPQSFISSYAPRLRAYANSLLTPVIQPATALAAPLSRTTKRGTTAINYAEDGFEDYDDDDDEGRRRPTGLRSLRRDESNQANKDLSEKVGKETSTPVEVQGIWRDWMGKARSAKSDMQNFAQAALPLTLIPIRIDVDIPAFTPAPPLPIPQGAGYASIDTNLPVYRAQEITVPYRLKDIFLWNLHETLTTTDQFAQTMVQDLDLPNRGHVANEISKQIRTQLEEYAGVALHPLFHSQQTPTANGVVTTIHAASRDVSATPVGSGNATPLRSANMNGHSIPSKIPIGTPQPEIKATAAAITPESDDFNPDDMYRCIVSLNVNLSNHLYTDKFEWSLLHPPGTAEIFAKQTCADIGLPGEWVPAMTHAIYEAVLRIKKEACESGGLVGGYGGGEIPNDSALGAEAGWRYDNETLAAEWEPRVEQLSKEEIEKREGDRERQIRRLRRETARFSSSAMMVGSTPQAGATGGYFDAEPSEERMGRGERSKKKKRFRSLSPLARSGTPGRGTPDAGGLAGYGGGGSLNDYERNSWRCTHCKIWGTAVWAVRDGPIGPRVRFNFPVVCALLTYYRLSAITAAFYMNAIENFPDGQKTYISPTYVESITDEYIISRRQLHFFFNWSGFVSLESEMEGPCHEKKLQVCY
jgi:chromatin structure-remodeling complex subunit SFH1